MRATLNTAAPVPPGVAGIAAVGFYLPPYRITAEEYRRAVGRFEAPGILEKSVPGFDEDIVTMAVAAGERALDAAGLSSLGLLAFATSGTAEGSTVAQALGLEDARAKEIGGSRDAGVQALSAALTETDARREASLVIVSDAPRADPSSAEEHALGSAAVAVLVTAKGGVVREKDAGPRADHRADDVLSRVGDAGAASPFLPFLQLLHRAKKEQRVALGDAATFIVTAKSAGDANVARALEGRTAITYEQYLGFRRYKPPPGGTEYSQGAYVSLPAYRAEAKARYRLIGDRCTKCGRLFFPPRESCLSCGGRDWEDAALRRTGKVYAHTVIGRGAAPSEFLEQQALAGEYATAVVELDDGPRITAMLTDVDPVKVRIGMPVRMVFRRIYTQEGVTRYGFKFAPG